MPKTVLRSKLRVPSILLALLFGWIGIGEVQNSQDPDYSGSRPFAATLGALSILIAIGLVGALVIKRVVLDGDVLRVYWGIRVTQYNRSDIAHVRYEEGSQFYAGYSIVYPVLEKTEGDEVALSFLARGSSGAGAAQVDEYVSIMNRWASEDRQE